MVGPNPVTQNPMPVVERVRALIAAGHPGEAASLCEQNLNLLPAGAEACLLKGLLLKITGHADDAVSAFDMALSYAPDALPAYMAIAEILADRGWLHSAVVVVETARQAAALTAEGEAELETLLERLDSITRAARRESP